MTHSPLASPSATLAVLKRHGLATKKSLGQHFLIDDNAADKPATVDVVAPGNLGSELVDLLNIGEALTLTGTQGKTRAMGVISQPDLGMEIQHSKTIKVKVSVEYRVSGFGQN